MPTKQMPKYLIFLDPRLQAVGEKRLGSMKEWFDKRLDEAYNAAEERDNAKNSKCNTIIIKCTSLNSFGLLLVT